MPGLRYLIGKISGKINNIDARIKSRSTHDLADQIEQTKYRETEMRRFLQGIIADVPAARMTEGHHAMTLFVLGARTTCTSGYYQLAKNWIRAAERRIFTLTGERSHESL
ncbi:hypothetical protein TMO_0071 [Tistrella mobilis KA081020-065]|uniref:Uncharacterized protein n=1 Tax=Tistrella mobilis (strain KA081020-065) TaxID=1110502 RepID=I3TGM2_TISMK|nr:hypothetical protein TMO_0071 [Tistrella mobilis KA081020-065]